MGRYEFTIAITDKPDNPLPSKKEGDIISMIPYPGHWGRKVIDEYLVVIVETLADINWLQIMAHERLYRDKRNTKLVGYIQYINETEDGENEEYFEIVNKRRYSIPLAKVQLYILDIDLVKVQDPTKIYQPFKSSVQLIEKFDGLEGRHKLEEKDVETTTASVGKDQEIIIDLDLQAPMIWDKLTNTYIRP